MTPNQSKSSAPSPSGCRRRRKLLRTRGRPAILSLRALLPVTRDLLAETGDEPGVDARLLALGRWVLFFAIAVPVALILAAWAWVTWDKSSAVRRAVNSAIEKLVDGAELEAERAKNAALRKILDQRERQAEADREALRSFADQLAAATDENGTLADALALIENQPIDPLCRIDRALLERLHQQSRGAAHGG